MVTYNTQQEKHLMTTQKQSEESDMAIPSMFKPPFLTVVKNDRHDRVELHLRGYFESPQENTQQLTELYQLAEQYSTVLVYITSAGGRVDLLMELSNALRKFDTMITVVNSDASSAGFMLWASGDVRVVCEHAELMIHRESSGYANKTDALLDRAEFMKRRFERIFTSFCSSVLTEEEMTRARLTEVWFTGEDMINRGHAISWDQFHTADTTPYNSIELIERNGSTYIRNGNYLTPVDISATEDAMYSVFDILYDVPDKRNVIEGQTLAQVAGLESVEEEESEDIKRDSEQHSRYRGYRMTDVLDEGTIRSIMRSEFGSYNYRIHRGRNQRVTCIINGTEFTVIHGDFYNLTVADLKKEIDRVIEEV